MLSASIKKHPLIFSVIIFAALNIISLSLYSAGDIAGRLSVSPAQAASASTTDRSDPLLSFSYSLQTQTISGYFTEVSGLGSESVVIEHTVVDRFGNEVIEKHPGTLNYYNIVLRRSVTSNMDIWQWRQEVEDGQIDHAKKNGTINMLSADGSLLAQWDFENAWPVSISGVDEDGKETLVLVCEKIERVQ